MTEAVFYELPEEVLDMRPRLQLILVVTVRGVELLLFRQKGARVEGATYDATEPQTIAGELGGTIDGGSFTCSSVRE